MYIFLLIYFYPRFRYSNDILLNLKPFFLKFQNESFFYRNLFSFSHFEKEEKHFYLSFSSHLKSEQKYFRVDYYFYFFYGLSPYPSFDFRFFPLIPQLVAEKVGLFIPWRSLLIKLFSYRTSPWFDRALCWFDDRNQTNEDKTLIQ